MDDTPVKPERFIRLEEVCRRVGLGKSMVYKLIGQGRFPRQFHITGAAVCWSEAEIVAWIDEVKDGFEGKRRKW